MALGKLSPRQKMINLMYLVFIAMLAMTMSKEVLSAFGYMNEKLIESNISVTEKNAATLSNLETRASEQPDKYENLYKKASKVNKLSIQFNNYLEEKKKFFTSTIQDPTDYETMDKTVIVDSHFFEGEDFTKAGKEFLNKIATYKEEVLKVIGEKSPLAESIKKRFDTSDQKVGQGKQKWLNNRYEGFPLISTITNLTAMQTDVKNTESEILGALLGNKLESEVSMSNYKTILIPEKTAYFQGENFKGKIVLGRYDATLKPKEVIVNGKKIETIEDGGAILDFPAGAVGEQQVKGKFIFIEKGKPIEIPIEGSYAVISKPNSAVISADKMNVVYRGVANPMTISIPGISDHLVRASAPGLKKVAGSGKYIMRPQQGKTVKITVSGTLPDGSKVSNSQTFRIKGIPAPVATVRKQSGHQKMPKSSLANTTVGVALPDFDFDIKLTAVGFTLKVPGQSAVVVRGNRMDARAQKAISRARRGDVVTIYNVKSSLVGGGGYRMKNATPVTIEIQ